MWEIVKKSLDKNEVENLTNFVEDRLFKVFLKLLGYKLCVWKEIYTCELYVILTPYHVWFSSNHLIWFPLSLWQRNQIQVSAFSLWMTRSSLLPMGGKRFLNYVWVSLLPMRPRDHIQGRSYLTRSLCCL